jgi:hypothetical protein
MQLGGGGLEDLGGDKTTYMERIQAVIMKEHNELLIMIVGRTRLILRMSTSSNRRSNPEPGKATLRRSCVCLYVCVVCMCKHVCIFFVQSSTCL